MVRLNEEANLNLGLHIPPKPYFSGGGYNLSQSPIETHAWAKEVFTDTEMDAIINIGNSIGLGRGITQGRKFRPEVRNSFVAFIYPNEVTAWVFEKLAHIINQINDNYFQFDLYSMEEGLQFTRYQLVDENQYEHYGWHTDIGEKFGRRKLSLSLQLSNPDEYEGGDLQVTFGAEPTTLSRERGVINFFPSYTLHRVTPVTKGVRYSLVCWVTGPKFR